ncbi:hypothetical protein D3C85_1509200 [compost metagenome]
MQHADAPAGLEFQHDRPDRHGHGKRPIVGSAHLGDRSAGVPQRIAQSDLQPCLCLCAPIRRLREACERGDDPVAILLDLRDVKPQGRRSDGERGAGFPVVLLRRQAGVQRAAHVVQPVRVACIPGLYREFA